MRTLPGFSDSGGLHFADFVALHNRTDYVADMSYDAENVGNVSPTKCLSDFSVRFYRTTKSESVNYWLRNFWAKQTERSAGAANGDGLWRFLLTFIMTGE